MSYLTEEEGDAGISDLDRTMPREHTKSEGLEWDRGHNDSYDSAIAEYQKCRKGIRLGGGCCRCHSNLDHHSKSRRVGGKTGAIRASPRCRTFDQLDPPGLMAPRVTRYTPSANCGIVTAQKNAAIILFFNVRAYILEIYPSVSEDPLDADHRTNVEGID